MEREKYNYLIVGAGVAAAYAIEGIRDMDENGSILMIGNEEYFPYNRPPLSKKLWFGEKKVDDIFVYKEDFYIDNNVDILLGTQVKEIDSALRTVITDRGHSFDYDKLLLATGGTPRRLEIPGADLEGICYYRYLDDYLKTRAKATAGKTAVVIGGGFIGSELAASLTKNGVQVTMIFPEDHIAQRVFPRSLALAVENLYLERNTLIFKGDVPVSFEKLNGGRYLTKTRNGKQFESDIVIVGAGIKPETELARLAGLEVGNGIIVNENLQTSNPFIYAAGDNAFFPYQALGANMRVEHWDNAIAQGRHAGWNMAGNNQAYDYMPFFFSDIFDFAYSAVGEVNAELSTFSDWEEEYKRGVIYYLQDYKVKGVMMVNIHGKIDDARRMIREGREMIPLESLCGAIRSDSAGAKAA
ncbi:MAG: FAD/NAD(P)-binding oxidoreductase [Armatimonadota bacterium]|jgi:3-phenylpropionate/trans-cinnamate dioxygenase ferredoxin reductase subunit